MKRLVSLALTVLMIITLTASFSVGAPSLAAGEPTLDKTELYMLLGGSLETLNVLNAPEGAAITWASDDLRVARVSGGKVISVGEGNATVTANVGGAALTCAVTVYRDDLLVANDVFIKDTDGNPIYAQCGSIYQYKEGEPYYWYGVYFGSSASYYNSLKTGNGTPGGSSGASVRCYSSYNLVDWKYEGVMCTSGQERWPTGWFARIGVVYHAESDTYVLIGQGGAAVAFGYSDTPVGPFTFHGTQYVNNLLPDGCDTGRTGDQTIYFDNRTGRAYVVYCNDGVDGTTSYGQDLWHTLPERGVIYVAELDGNNRFLSMKAAYEIYDTKKDTYYNLRREGGREANCIFYYDGWYYNAASGLAGWNVSPNFYMGGARTPIDKTYVNEVGLPNNMSPMRGSSSNFSHSSQVVAFVTVDTPVTEQSPKGQLVIGLGDRWCQMIGNHTGGHGWGYNVFAPLSFLDPKTAPPLTKEDEPKTPNPLQYRYYPSGLRNEDYYPWGDMDSFYPFIPKNYPYDEWKRPEWDIPVFNAMSQFYLDIAAGTWEPGPNNNYLENPEFEQDRIDKCVQMSLADGTPINYPVVQDYVNEPNGWKAEHISGQTAQINYGGNRNSNARDRTWQLLAPGSTTQNWYSVWAGNMTWYHGYTKRNLGTDPYQTRTYQEVKVPDGRYNFYGWVRSSGGQNEAYVYAGDLKVDISAPIDAWTLVTIEDFFVSGGKVEVGFYSDASADQWVFFDDFALVAVPVDKSELGALVAKAQAYKADQSTNWAELSAALDEAIAVLENDDARQTWVNSAWTRLYLAANDFLFADIRADEANVVVNNPVSYTVSLDKPKGAGVVELSFTFDGYVLDKDSIAVTPLNGFDPGVFPGLSLQYIGSGVWQGTVKYMCPGYVNGDGPLDILKISATAIATGPATVTLTGFAASGDNGAGLGPIPSQIGTAAATVIIGAKPAVYSKYDLNQDGSIDETDLLYLIYFYQWNDRDPGWATDGLYGVYAKDCDFQVNGKVDLADMIELTANYGAYDPYAW